MLWVHSGEAQVRGLFSRIALELWEAADRADALLDGELYSDRMERLNQEASELKECIGQMEVEIQCMDLEKDLILDDFAQLKTACERAIQFNNR